MDQIQVSRKDLIPYIGWISKVSELLSRKRPLSLSMIRRLNQGFGIPADILIEDVETDGSGNRTNESMRPPSAHVRRRESGLEIGD